MLPALILCSTLKLTVMKSITRQRAAQFPDCLPTVACYSDMLGYLSGISGKAMNECREMIGCKTNAECMAIIGEYEKPLTLNNKI